MSTTNLMALGLTVPGIGCVLYGLALGGFPLLAGSEATIEMLRWLDGAAGREPAPLLEPLLEHPVGFVLLNLAVMAILMAAGLAFTTAGFIVWRRSGRRALQLDEEDAAREPQREQTLQWLIRDHLEHALASGSEDRDGLDGERNRRLGTLDALRLHRFELFLHESGLDSRPPAPPPGAWRPSADSTEPKRLAARILVILLAGASAFAFLWGILSAFSVRLMQDLLGFPEGTHGSVLALLVSWVGTLTLLAAAVGVHHLARWDRRIEERRRKGLVASAERTLTGYGECLQRIPLPRSAEDERSSAALARGLTLSGLYGLDGEGRREMLRIGRDHGAVSADGDLIAG